MGELFGLPAHPLLAHAPLVLLPVLAVATLVVAARPGWHRHAWWLVAATLVVFVLVMLATQSGEDLMERMDNEKLVRTHQNLAETTRLLAFLQLAAALAFALLRTLGARGRSALSRVAPAALAVTVLLGALSTVWLVRTGHEGARITWSGLPKAKP